MSKFKPNEVVIIRGEIPAFRARIKWISSIKCEEHNDTVYKCQFWLDGHLLNADFCESIIEYDNVYD